MTSDFFSAQAEAKKKSFWLLVVFFCLTIIVSVVTALAVVFVLNPTGPFLYSRMKPHFDFSTLFYASLLVFCAIVFGAWTMSRRLKKLGVHGLLAEAGAKRIWAHGDNHFETRFRNVAQEMAIACGLPVPALYVIPDDLSINAFAAGNSPSDACIVVTSGALHCLLRAELQGVVAHEFSHILNSDITLNMELISVLHGYTMISSLGRDAMRARKGPKAIGFALFICGLAGLWISTLVKAFFSRQREWLADASAVQFTRNPAGLRGALEKIDLNQHATITKLSNADSFSHMFFAAGMHSFFENILSTHPPIAHRIRALGKPSYRSPSVKMELKPLGLAELNAVSLGIANGANGANDANGTEPTATNSLEKAQNLIGSLPVELRDACAVPHKAFAVCIAILIHYGSSTKENALDFLKQKKLFSQTFLDYMREIIFPKLTKLSLLESMTLLTLACATIRNAEHNQRRELVQNTHAILTSDNTTTLTEICIFITLCSLILDNHELRCMGSPKTANTTQDVVSLMAFVAHIGAAGSLPKAQEAFDTALTHLQLSAQGVPSLSKIGVDALLRAVGHVRIANPQTRRQIVFAITKCIAVDGKVIEAEREILRAICMSIQYPMPLENEPQNTP